MKGSDQMQSSQTGWTCIEQTKEKRASADLAMSSANMALIRSNSVQPTKKSVCPKISRFPRYPRCLLPTWLSAKDVIHIANNYNIFQVSQNIQISKMSKGIRCVGLVISSAASASELESTFAQPLTFLPTHQLTTIVFVIKHKTNIKHKRYADLQPEKTPFSCQRVCHCHCIDWSSNTKQKMNHTKK